MNKIKPINFSCIIDNINNPQIDGYTHINNHITANKFSHNTFNPLEQTNTKWFIDLSGENIPAAVSNLLQFGSNFSLQINTNKKTMIHEFIKDIENNSNNLNNLNAIRNIAIPQSNYFFKQ